MKINEATLICYATSADTPAEKEGWLWKRGDVNKAFQKRYFVLKGNLLFYFEKQTDKEPVGVIILEGCTIELAEEEIDKFAFKICFHGEGKRVYTLGTDHAGTLEQWMKLLAAASYDYMKLMVMELQQKLQELDELDQHQQQLVTIQQTNKIPTSNSNPKLSRSNPFNRDEEETVKRTKAAAASTIWPQIHATYGQRILADRHRWCQKHSKVTF